MSSPQNSTQPDRAPKLVPLPNRFTSGPDPDEMNEWAPRIPFEYFQEGFKWAQGEHVGMIGPTGAGKTTLGLWVAEKRQYVSIFVTKPEDEVMSSLVKKDGKGYHKMQEWKNLDPDRVPKRLVWPDARKLYSMDKQVAQFKFAFQEIYEQGSWTVFIDELFFVVNHLKLGAEIKTFLTQARSLRISLLLLTQRPAHVPLEVYDQSTHLFFWRENDDANLDRLGGISWANSKILRELIANLDLHECLYINTRIGAKSMVRFTAPERIV